MIMSSTSSSSDEEDYMSTTFLADLEKNAGPDTKGGRLGNTAVQRQKRKAAAEALAREVRQRPIPVLEHERRTQALNTPLDSTNKGFNMLRKMGYKPGNALGKEGGIDGAGLKEPIGIEIIKRRNGLGMGVREKEEERKKQDRDMAEIRQRSHNELALRGDFQSRLRQQRREKRTISDLRASCRVCEDMDTQAHISRTIYWLSPYKTSTTPRNIVHTKHGDAYIVARVLDPRHGLFVRLVELVDGVTNVTAVDDADLSTHVDGKEVDDEQTSTQRSPKQSSVAVQATDKATVTHTEQSHVITGDRLGEKTIGSKRNVVNDEKEVHEETYIVGTDRQYITVVDVLDELDSNPQPSNTHLLRSVWLKDVTAYLRDRHLYCHWCGRVYESESQLNMICPGSTAEDHDD
eukprot:CFRG6245T1